MNERAVERQRALLEVVVIVRRQLGDVAGTVLRVDVEAVAVLVPGVHTLDDPLRLAGIDVRRRIFQPIEHLDPELIRIL